MCVPLIQLPYDLRREVTVFGVWITLMHLFRTLRKTQVIPAAGGSPKLSRSVKQKSFCLTLLRVTLLRERATQEIFGVHSRY
jgi:hypothetical protein